MKEVFRNADSAWVGLYQSILEEAGIPTFVYNLCTLQMPAAGLAVAFFPLPIFFPTLCVLSDVDYDAAMDLLQNVRHTFLGADWTCATCRESAPDNFDLCWNCQTPRDDDEPFPSTAV